MAGLPKVLHAVPRLETPRQSVPKGAVGIAAGQTGVYTLASPGGWHLLGKTDLELFDPTKDPPSILQPGDRVRFVGTTRGGEEEEERITESSSSATASLPSSPSSPSSPFSPSSPCLEILTPGPMTSVQDLGRRGYGRNGVSRSGAADDFSLRNGNALLGNDVSCAGLEIAMGGLQVRCVKKPVVVSLTGAECNAKVERDMLQGAPSEIVQSGWTVALRVGDVLTMGYATNGARSYLCVEGGIDVPIVLGSRSTDLRAKMGGMEGRILQKGDVLGQNSLNDGSTATLLSSSSLSPKAAKHTPLRTDPSSDDSLSSSGRVWTLRVLPGPGHPEQKEEDAVGGQVEGEAKRHPTLERMLRETFEVTPRADRMAVVVSLEEENGDDGDGGGGDGDGDGDGDSESSGVLVGGQQMSEACVSGTIQVPPDGSPVILLAEHQTTGGYDVPGIVIQVSKVFFNRFFLEKRRTVVCLFVFCASCFLFLINPICVSFFPPATTIHVYSCFPFVSFSTSFLG